MPEPAVPEGRSIGPYRLLKLIGEGGMGEVYLAERENEFRKRVAIKLIRAGMGSQDVVRRFVTERNLLASLNHPHIVRLVDGGATNDGLPYLVVDYVEGIPIDAYCENHKLSIPARLRLFADVCDAVHYAHQSLIVHCDLKPGNILVTEEGTAMLLDFGIAKLIDPVALGLNTQTLTRARAYTPNYASPEQLRGEPVTTATDIYALGVILYELLTGQSPYRVNASGSLVEWVRSVCEDDTDAPSRRTEPSEQTRRLEGDLDAIALKALRKDPRDRYGSVDQMAEDIRRHLDGRPVMARRNTAGYVARKFLLRHKFVVIAAALLLITLTAGLASTLWEARIAARRFDDVRSLAHVFLFDVHDSIQNLPGSTEARSLIAKTGAEYLDRLARDARGNSSLELELAQGYLKIGDVEGNPFMANLGDTAQALVNYRKALAIAESEVARHPNDEKARQVLAGVQLGLAAVLPFRGQGKEGLLHARQALDIYRQIAAAHPTSVENSLDVSRAAETVGDIQGGLQGINLGLVDEALASYRQSIAAIPEVPPGSQFYERASRAKAVMLAKIADMTLRRGESLPAQETYKSALTIAEDLLQRNPNNTKLQGVVTSILNRLASSETQVGDTKDALESFRKSMAINDAALAVDPNNERARGGVAVDRKNVGDLYMYVVQDAAQALHYYQQAANVLDEDVRRDPRNMIWSQRLSEVLIDVASCEMSLGKPDQALTPAKRGLEIAKAMADRPGATMAQVYNYAWLAVSVDPESLRNFAVALPYAQRAVEMSHGQDPQCLYTLAQAYAGMGKMTDAIAAAKKALALYPPHTAGQPVSHNQAVVERAIERYRAQIKK